MSFLDDVKSPPNNLKSIQFSFIVNELLTKLDGISKDNLGNFSTITAKKTFVIQSFIKQWRQHIGPNIYNAAKLIFPNRDSKLYFIREITFARMIVKIFNIPKKSDDYSLLTDNKKYFHDYKHLNKHGAKVFRSFPKLVAQVISTRRFTVVQSNLTIEQVNDILDRLSSSESSSVTVQRKIIEDAFNQMTIEEIRWFAAILLKKSLLGNFEATFFYSWHPDAPRLINICGSLSKVFWLLSDQSIKLTESQLKPQMFYPFLPQLSHKLSISYEKLTEKMNNDFLIEEKMDGDRMLMHMNEGNFMYYSRRRKNYTHLYGANYNVGSLTKHLSRAFDERVTSVILDGEMLAWDYKREVILPFGTLKTAAVQNAVREFTTTDMFESQSSWPLFLIFDILNINGKDLTDFPLGYRKMVLSSVIRNVTHKFEVLPYFKASTKEDIELAIKKIISERGEGIMVKSLSSSYHVASRNNSWVKVKPEYLENFGENLDLIVIGVIPGIKNSYMCALKDVESGIFKSFCTVANGFSDADFDKIQRLTFNKWHRYAEFAHPKDLEFGSKKPTLWIHPKDSVVLEIRARSVDSLSTKTYAVGTTLHNLYCRRIRDDKSYETCATITDFFESKEQIEQRMGRSQSVIKNRRKLIDSFEDTYKKKIKVIPKDQIFSSLTFIVLTGYSKVEGISSTELKRQIKLHGGTLSNSPYNIFNKSVVVLTESLTIKSCIFLDQGFDLISPKWVLECTSAEFLVPLDSSHVVSSNNPELSSHLKLNVDPFGDNYVSLVPFSPEYSNQLNIYEPLSPECFNSSRVDFIQDLGQLDLDAPVGLLFSGLSFYILCLKEGDFFKEESLKKRISKYSGSFSDFVHCAFLVIPECYARSAFREKIVKEVDEISKEISRQVNFTKTGVTPVPQIVNESFVLESIRNNVIVDPRDHLFV